MRNQAMRGPQGNCPVQQSPDCRDQIFNNAWAANMKLFTDKWGTAHGAIFKAVLAKQ